MLQLACRAFGYLRGIGVYARIAFALIAIRLFSLVSQPGSRIYLNDIGIEDHNNGFGLIEWRDIRSATIGRIDDTEYITLTVHNEVDYLARLSPFKRRTSKLGLRMDYPPIYIAMFNVKIKPEELLELIHFTARN